MSASLLTERPNRSPITTEKQLRRQIDRSVARALVDSEYARRLLSDPTIALERSGCSPQQYKSLRNIHAIDVLDFARQAQAVFWRVEPNSAYLEEQLPLAAAAAR
jgi:hypothetical protein